MCMYTIVDLNEVFYPQTPQTREYMSMGNLHFEGISENGGFKIDRIISTDPADYIKNGRGLGDNIKI